MERDIVSIKKIYTKYKGERIMWTCSICSNEYDSSNGDTDERMCHNCMDDWYGDNEDNE